jgi:ATP-binding cassette subfamily B protein
MNTQLKKSILDFMINIVTVFSYGVVLYMLFLSVMNQQVTVGAFAAILTNLGRIYNLMDEVISERFGWASENIASVENFLNFIQEDEKQKKQDCQRNLISD